MDIAQMQPITRNHRGPLRALHNSTDLLSTPRLQDGHNEESTTINKKSNESYSLEAEGTPVQRVSLFPSMDDSQENAFPPPLRTSSCRSSKSQLMSAITSAEDIRNHFRVRAISNVKVGTKIPVLANDVGLQTKSSETNTVSVPCERQPSGTKRRRSERSDCAEIACKLMRRFDSSNVENELKSAHLTMGAFVKAHPRYTRRQSGADPSEMYVHAVPLNRRLSPVCPVPMPSGFPTLLPAPCTAVSLPCDTGQSSVSRKTVETQTTPTASPVASKSVEGNSSRRTRQSVGSSNVLNGLKRTLGNLRRAMSAERLHVSSKGLNNMRTQSDNPIKPSPKLSSTNTSPFTGKWKFRRAESRERVGVTDLRHSSTSTSFTEVEAGDKIDSDGTCFGNMSGSCRTTSTRTSANCLNYRILNTYSDGSVRLQLRRPNTSSQFGFFIARDAQGVYISRLGSVRCTVKLWDVLHVGDRILEVQGVPCAQLEVEHVQNLIRGCELVEFRVQSSCKQR